MEVDWENSRFETIAFRLQTLEADMLRECSYCHRPFTRNDFVKQESKGMEAERKALGLEGVHFLYYACPECGYADIFLDVCSLEGEDHEAFRSRREALETAVRQVHADKAEVVLTEKRRGQRPTS